MEQNQGLLEIEDDTSPPIFDTFFAPKEWKDTLISKNGGWKEFYRSYATHVSNVNIRKDQDGALMFAACQYPSPTPMNHVANNTVHVAMAKRQDDAPMPKTCIKVCSSENIAALEKDGWTLWKHPRQEWERLQQLLEDRKLREFERQRRLDNNTGRPMEKINYQAPQHDTKNMFKREISLLQGSETKSTWQPGELLGPVPTQALILLSATSSSLWATSSTSARQHSLDIHTNTFANRQAAWDGETTIDSKSGNRTAAIFPRTRSKRSMAAPTQPVHSDLWTATVVALSWWPR